MARRNKQKGLKRIRKGGKAQSTVVTSGNMRHPLGLLNMTSTGGLLPCPHGMGGDYFTTITSGTSGSITTSVSSPIVYQYNATLTPGEILWSGQDSYLHIKEGVTLPLLNKNWDIYFLINHLDFLRYSSGRGGHTHRALMCGGLSSFSMNLSQYNGLTVLTRGSVNTTSFETRMAVVLGEDSKDKTHVLSSESNAASLLAEGVYRAMHNIRDIDLDNMREVLARVDKMPNLLQGTFAKGPTFNGCTIKRPSLEVSALYKNPIMGPVALMSPKDRDTFFGDLRKMPDKVFDYVLCKFIHKVNNGADGQGGTAYPGIPENLTSEPSYSWDTGEYKGRVFEIFLESNRNHPKRYWTDYFQGSYCHGFLTEPLDILFTQTTSLLNSRKLLPKSLGTPEVIRSILYVPTAKDEVDVNPQDDISTQILIESNISARAIMGMFTHAPVLKGTFREFPKLSRYDLTPLQAVTLYAILDRNHGNLQHLSGDLSWVWTPSLERVLMQQLVSQCREEAGNRYFIGVCDDIESKIGSALRNLNTYLSDGYNIYNQYTARHGMLRVAGGLSRRLEISGHNHMMEQQLPRAVRMLPSNTGESSFLRCVVTLDARLERYRVRKRETLKYLGTELHHCIGSSSDKDHLYFCHGTVCAQTDSLFKKINQCYDAWNKKNRKSRSFEKFLNKAMRFMSNPDAQIRLPSEYAEVEGNTFEIPEGLVPKTSPRDPLIENAPLEGRIEYGGVNGIQLNQEGIQEMNHMYGGVFEQRHNEYTNTTIVSTIVKETSDDYLVNRVRLMGKYYTLWTIQGKDHAESDQSSGSPGGGEVNVDGGLVCIA